LRQCTSGFLRYLCFLLFTLISRQRRHTECAYYDAFGFGHGFAVHRDGIRFVRFEVVAAAGAREDKVNGEVDEADRGAANTIEERFDAVDVDAAGHVGGELAGFELAGAFAIEDRGELVAVKEAGELITVIAVAGDDALAA
jgi:hypothetical protein